MSTNSKNVGQRRTKIEKIEHLSCRQVTFSKRRKGLFRKAEIFSKKCKAEIGVIVFSNTNKVYKTGFPSSIEDILTKRNKFIKERGAAATDEGLISSSAYNIREIAQMMEENKALSLDGMRLKGMELDDLGLRELNELEQQIWDGIQLIDEERKKLIDVGSNSMLASSDRLDGNSGNNLSRISGSSAQTGSSDSSQIVVLNQS